MCLWYVPDVVVVPVDGDVVVLPALPFERFAPVRPVALAFDHVLRPLEEVRDPPDVAFGEGKLEVRVLDELPAEQPVQHRARRAGGTPTGVGHVRGHRADLGQIRRRPDVGAQHDVGVVAGLEHRIPVLGVDVGEGCGTGDAGCSEKANARTPLAAMRSISFTDSGMSHSGMSIAG